MQARKFFPLLTCAQRDSLMALGTGHIYRPGQVMMREGHPGTIVIIILDGLAKVTALSERGKEILLGFRGSGDLVGEMAVLSHQPRSATVTAATRLSARKIPAQSFVAYLERSPQVANQVTDIMAGKLREANRRRVDFSSNPAECRVATELADVALAYGRDEEGAWRIGAEITQADLASLAAASVRTVERILQAFEKDGLVVRRRRDLIVADLDALRARGKYDRSTRHWRDCVPSGDGNV